MCLLQSVRVLVTGKCLSLCYYFVCNLEWPEHFAVLMKAWVSKKLGSIYMYLKILIGMGVWLPGVGSSFNMAPRSEVEPTTSSDLYGICLKWL